MDISVVVCTYNRSHLLRRALESVCQQEINKRYSYEVIVIDDGSTDDTKDVVRQISVFSDVPIRYIYKEGGGVADARNRGIEEAKGRWVAFFDDDQSAECYWLMELLRLAEETGAYCIGGAVRLMLSEDELDNLSPVYRMVLGETVGHDKIEKFGPKRYPGTGNVLIKREVFSLVGKFDKSLTGGGDDTDFFLRTRQAGLDIWYTPRAVVYHYVPDYCLTDKYFRYVSLRWGSEPAHIDFIRFGRGRMLLFCIARIGQALIINIPRFLIAVLNDDRSEKVDRKSLVWRCVGYTRKCCNLLAPRLFAQERFFSKIDFRKGQKRSIRSSNLFRNSKP